MSENQLAKNLAKEFENELSSFLNLSWIEKLEKAEDFFKAGNYLKGEDRFTDNRTISSIFKELAEYEKQALEKAGGEELYFNSFNNGNEEIYFNSKNTYLDIYLSKQFERLAEYLPYFLLLLHILSDNTYHQISYEHKEELREVCGLKRPSDRQEAFLKLFKFLINEKVVNGGSESLWHTQTRLYFLSLYEKFSIVLGNARNDYKTLFQQQIPPLDIKKEILKKYRIPECYYKDITVKKCGIQFTARKWAKHQMQKTINEKHLAKMGFGDEYLRKFVIPEAEKEAVKICRCKCQSYENHKLIFFTFGDNSLQHAQQLERDGLKELKFDSFVEKEYPGMALYFL